MDGANFLLTEVSLQLLRNSFFDINGMEHDSLNGLVSKATNKIDMENNPLMTALGEEYPRASRRSSTNSGNSEPSTAGPSKSAKHSTDRRQSTSSSNSQPNATSSQNISISTEFKAILVESQKQYTEFYASNEHKGDVLQNFYNYEGAKLLEHCKQLKSFLNYVKRPGK